MIGAYLDIQSLFLVHYSLFNLSFISSLNFLAKSCNIITCIGPAEAGLPAGYLNSVR